MTTIVRNKKNFQSNTLNINAVSQLSGITAFTLRSWEKRYSAISPQRTPSGQRVYNLEDVEKLKLLDTLVNQGYAISRIAALSPDKLKELLKLNPRPPLHSTPAPTPSPFPSQDPLLGTTQSEVVTSHDEQHSKNIHQTLGFLEKYLLEFNLDAISQCILRARTQFSIQSFVLDVISPFMAFLGEQVRLEKISIAQEHAFSAIARNHLGEIYQSLRNISHLPLNIIFATPEGEMHEFGIFLASILAVSHGSRSHYLGANLPVSSLIDATQNIQPQIVVLGVLGVQGSQVEATQRCLQYLSELHLQIPSHVQVWIGGPPQLLTQIKKKTVKILAEKPGRLIQYLPSLQGFNHLLKTFS